MLLHSLHISLEFKAMYVLWCEPYMYIYSLSYCSLTWNRLPTRRSTREWRTQAWSHPQTAQGLLFQRTICVQGRLFFNYIQHCFSHFCHFYVKLSHLSHTNFTSNLPGKGGYWYKVYFCFCNLQHWISTARKMCQMLLSLYILICTFCTFLYLLTL